MANRGLTAAGCLAAVFGLVTWLPVGLQDAPSALDGLDWLVQGSVARAQDASDEAEEPTRPVTLRGKTYASLVAGLEAARPGDTIRLSWGAHDADGFTAAVDGLKLVGEYGSCLSGDLEIEGDGVKLVGLLVYHGSITVVGDRCRVSRCRFSVESHLEVQGDHAVIFHTRFRCDEVGAALSLDGDAGSLICNTFSSSNPAEGARAVEVIGKRTRLLQNGFSDLPGLGSVTGDRTRLESNRVWRARGGIELVGDGVRVERNTFGDPHWEEDPDQRDPGTLVTVRGDGARVRRNSIRGLRVTAAEFVAEGARGIRPGLVAAWWDSDWGVGDVDLETATSPRGTGVVVVGGAARVERNTVSGLQFGIVVDGDAARVTRNGMASTDVGTRVLGADARVHQNRVDDALMGVDVEGDNVSVVRNTLAVGRVSLDSLGITGTAPRDEGTVVTLWDFVGEPVVISDCPGVRVNSGGRSGGAITRNVVSHPLGGSGYDLDVSNVTIKGNRDTGGDDATVSIALTGTGNVLQGNVVRASGEVAVEVTGDDNVARRNDLDGGGGDGLVVTGTGNVVDGNRVTELDGGGVHVSGDHNVVEHNAVKETASDAISIEGDDNDVERNRVDLAQAHGMVVEGSGNQLTANVIRSAGLDGFSLGGGTENVLTDCSVNSCGRSGLVNRAQNTTVVGTTFHENARDVFTLLPFRQFASNRFDD